MADQTPLSVPTQATLDKFAQRLSLAPDQIEETALNTLYSGLCTMRMLANRDTPRVREMADALHNLPLVLKSKEYEAIKQATVQAAYAICQISLAPLSR